MGHDRYSEGNEQQRGQTEGPNGGGGHNLKFTLDIVELVIKSKMKALQCFKIFE